MRGAVAVFVKTVGVSPVKTRLAKSIGKQKAEQFYKLSVEAVREVIEESCNGNNNLKSYWAVAEEDQLSYWGEAIYTGPGGLGDRLNNIYSKLLKTHDYAILIGADSPQITKSHIESAIKYLEEGSNFVMGRAHDGGFYLFAGKQKLDIWNDIEYSINTTAGDLQSAIGNDIIFLESLTDVDHVEDLGILLKEFKHPILKSQQDICDWCMREDSQLLLL